MALWDKQMLLEANALYRTAFENKSIESLTPEDLAAYAALRVRFLALLEDRFTAGNMAKYVLNTAGFSDAKRVLYLSGQTGEDYLRCVTLAGMKEVLGMGVMIIREFLMCIKENRLITELCMAEDLLIRILSTRL